MCSYALDKLTYMYASHILAVLGITWKGLVVPISLAPGSLNGLKLGEYYNRCRHLHPMLAAAMESLHFRAFLDMYGDIPETLLTGIIGLKAEPTSELMQTLKRNDDYEHLMTCYNA